MAIDLSKAKASPRHAGVYLLPDGRYLARAGVRLPNGKVKVLKRLLPPGATEVDAVNVVEALKAEALNPPPVSTPTRHHLDTNQTVEDYCDTWLATRRERLKPSAAKTYEGCISKHIVPRLGHLKVFEVNRGALESWTVWAQGRKMVSERRVPVIDADGKRVRLRNGHVKMRTEVSTAEYSHDTLRQWWRVLATIMKDMAADFRFPDPTERVRPPERPQQAPKREQITLDIALTEKLLAAAEEHTPERYAEIACLALTGMRVGELYALKWDCVDLKTNEVVIRRSISRGELTETTKTKSQRTVPLHPLLTELLEVLRKPIEEATHGLSEKEQKELLTATLVFPSEAGTPREPHSLDRPFKRLAAEIGLDINLGAQVLRRSMNSNLLRQSVERLTIRSIMGHTSEQMTARYYGAGKEEKMAAVLTFRRRVPEPMGDNNGGQQTA